ncbi:aa3-type cytochrome oxidase subunit CtaJ [Actinoplanes sp. CA-015351]|uniref:aa3-type cytochrome oxidase subunit CtaJ n=1 Tax=Actinoplanes sp. CA-015351 TaxID=3239897 RepID=UPI003D96F1FA
MSVISTVLVFVIIPAAVIGTVATLVFSNSDRAKPSRRYRPGQTFDFPAMWFSAAPEKTAAPAISGTAEKHGLVIEDSSGAPVRPGPTGGASDKW